MAVAQKVVPKYNPQLSVPGVPPAVIEIKTRSGEAYSKRLDYPRGHPKNPATMDELLKKFRDCMLYSAKPIPGKKVEQAIESILSLEKSEDISQVIQLFT